MNTIFVLYLLFFFFFFLFPFNYKPNIFFCTLLFKIARAIFDVEEATAKAFEIILEHKVQLGPLNLF